MNVWHFSSFGEYSQITMKILVFNEVTITMTCGIIVYKNIIFIFVKLTDLENASSSKYLQ